MSLTYLPLSKLLRRRLGEWTHQHTAEVARPRNPGEPPLWAGPSGQPVSRGHMGLKLAAGPRPRAEPRCRRRQRAGLPTTERMVVKTRVPSRQALQAQRPLTEGEAAAGAACLTWTSLSRPPRPKPCACSATHRCHLGRCASPTPLHASSAGAAAGRVSSHQSLPPVAASHAGSSLLSCQLNVDAGAGASLSLGSSAALTLPLCSSVISPSIRAGVCVPPRPLSGQWLQDPHFVTSPPLVLSWAQLKERLQERHFVTAVLAERVTAWLSRTVRGEWFFCCCWEAKGREEDLGGAAFCAAKSAMLET